jgi:hypothetical protein
MRRYAALHVITAILLFLHCGCSSDLNSEIDITPELKRLKTADPRADLIAALSTNDHRYLGVYGLTLVVPGINRKLPPEIIKPIRGTTDAPVNDEHLELQTIAHDYAEIYNLALDAFLKTNQIGTIR